MIVYDTGALIAAERDDRSVWADHRRALELGLRPVVPSTVLAQASRSPQQANLRRLIKGCAIDPLDRSRANEIGALLGRAETSDVVDGHVAVVALDSSARPVVVRTADPHDIDHLVTAGGPRTIHVVAV